MTPGGGIDTRVESWESPLFRQIVSSRLAVKEVADPEQAEALRRRAQDLEITLLTTMERDRPRLAVALARQLAAAVR